MSWCRDKEEREEGGDASERVSLLNCSIRWNTKHWQSGYRF